MDWDDELLEKEWEENNKLLNQLIKEYNDLYAEFERIKREFEKLRR